jgi:hypothetical protein
MLTKMDPQEINRPPIRNRQPAIVPRRLPAKDLVALSVLTAEGAWLTWTVVSGGGTEL